MNEADQLKILMEAVSMPSRNEPWEENIEEFRRELKAFANELPDSHYSDWLLQIINDEGTQLMAKVKEFADELSDPHYCSWLLQIADEYNKEGPDTIAVKEGKKRLPYDIEFDNEDITIFTLGGEPVIEMPLDDWMELISKFNRMFGAKRI